MWKKSGWRACAMMGCWSACIFAQSAKKMTVLANLDKYSGQGYSSVWGWIGPGHREYALVTVQNTGGVSIVDMQFPKEPREAAFLPSPKGMWHELKTFRNYLYKCADQGTAGVQIADLSGLPAQVRELAAYKAGGVERCHTLWIDSTRAPALLYIQQSRSPGVIIVSLQNPAQPVEVARVNTQCHDMWARGDRLYVSTGPVSTWDIWDVSTAAAPRRITQTRFATVNAGLGEPTGTISHNVWLSEDGKVAFTSEETPGTTVKAWDIGDERSPKLLGTYLGAPGVMPHNVLIHRHLMYVTHYNAGLRVVDIRDPRNMKEVAYHRPNPADTPLGGSWGAYNFFPSGLVIHADVATGLYILEPDPDIKITWGNVGVTGKGIRSPLPGSATREFPFSDWLGRKFRAPYAGKGPVAWPVP
jgi:choice-of-anchor B domain-containing protein